MVDEKIKNFGVIYCLKDPSTLKIRYIGQTIQSINLRLKQHLWQSIKHKNHLGNWLNSLNNTPIIEILEKCMYSELNKKELYWINFYKDNKLTNSMKGCELSGHYTHSGETKRKIGKATFLRQLGTKHSEETKKKISNSHKGKKLSKETINKIIESRRKNGNWVMAEETKRKISKANKGRSFSKRHRKRMSESSKKDLFVLNIIKSELVKTCIKDFAEYLNVYPNAIHSRLTKYKGKIYRSKFYLSSSRSELKKLMLQLNIKQ